MKIERSFIVCPRNLDGEDEQTLFQLIDINDALHFELLWVGTHWVDCPGETIEQAIISRVEGIQDWTTAPKDWFEVFFPGAMESRFNEEQQRQIDALQKLDVADRPQRIAELVHKIQKDKAGRDYIDHPKRVAQNAAALAEKLGLSETETADVIAGAWLHDVLEDSGDEAWPLTLPSDLAEWGISRNALSIAEFLTRENSFMVHLGEKSGDEYYENMKANPQAVLVKCADIADNLNFERMEWMVEAGKTPKPEKYIDALRKLDPDTQILQFVESRVEEPAELK